jgi:hypothetical protein
MTTIRQLIQTTPATANELFAKLADTSASALKTRERLFGELKEELTLLANLEEQHLFPVLRKHKELKVLVREALNDNKETRKLLAELENTPRDTEEFGAQVAELRKVFQQHVRDEKKELLPAILEALTEEEANGVVEKIEAEIAAVEEAKRAEAEERRAEARREREKLEAEQEILEEARRAEAQQRRALARQERELAEQAQAATETIVNVAWAAPLTAQRTATAAQEVLQNGVGATSKMMNGAGEQAEHAMSALVKQNQNLVAQTSESLQILFESGNSFMSDIQQMSATYMDASRERFTANLEGWGAIFASRTLAELLEAQSALLRNNIELTVASRNRIKEAVARPAGKNARSSGKAA